MNMSQENEEPTQQTQPQRGEPVEIPVPSKAQVMADFEKIATSQPEKDEDDEDHLVNTREGVS